MERQTLFKKTFWEIETKEDIKQVKSMWDEKYQALLEKLNEAILIKLILKHLYFNIIFILKTYWSLISMVSLLIQTETTHKKEQAVQEYI